MGRGRCPIGVSQLQQTVLDGRFEFGFGLEPDDAIDLLAALDHHDGGDGPDPMLDGQLRGFIGVHFEEVNLVIQ